jgi:hypothetical protein
MTPSQTVSAREERPGKKKAKKAREPRITDNLEDFGLAVQSELAAVVEKDDEEIELERELFGGSSGAAGLGHESGQFGSGLGLGFEIDKQKSKAIAWSDEYSSTDSDEEPEELGTKQAFVIDRKGNEREKIKVKPAGHVKFDYEDDNEPDNDDENEADKDDEDIEDAEEASDVDSAPGSDASDISSKAEQQPKPIRKPAWTDTSDSLVAIGATAPARARKLRQTPDEDSISTSEYEARLRQQFEKTHEKPEWAMTATERELIGVKRSRHADSDSEDEGVDALFRRTGAIVDKANEKRVVPKGAIGMRRMRDANWQGVSEVSLTAEPSEARRDLFSLSNLSLLFPRSLRSLIGLNNLPRLPPIHTNPPHNIPRPHSPPLFHRRPRKPAPPNRALQGPSGPLRSLVESGIRGPGRWTPPVLVLFRRGKRKSEQAGCPERLWAREHRAVFGEPGWKELGASRCFRTNPCAIVVYQTATVLVSAFW